MNVKSRKILITYGWCRTSYLALRSLAYQGYEVYSCSSSTPAMCQWSRFSRKNQKVPDPFLKPEEYAFAVGKLVTQWKIDAVLPGHEDALPLRRFQKLLPDVPIICPSLEVLEHALDKGWITEQAQSIGVPVPRTKFPGSVDEAIADSEDLGFPLIIKLRRGNSGKGVVAVKNVEEMRDILLNRFRLYTQQQTRFPILQEYMPGQVVGVCFLAHEGRIVASFGERYLRCKDGQFGTSVFREPLVWPKLNDYVALMIKQLHWTGLGHFDFIEAEDQSNAYLLELNPRLWGAINLAYINGFNFPAAVVAQTFGEENLDRYFDLQSDSSLRSIWLIGEMIAAVNRWRDGESLGPVRAFLGVMKSLPNSRFDDLLWHDPFAFLGEAACYAKMFIRAGGSTNPANDGMLG